MVDRAYQKALEILENCSHRLGIKASSRKHGYPQIWTRDSMITLLGALLTKDNRVIKTLRASIKTLAKNQTPLGVMPNNVHTYTGKVDFRAYADGGLWFVIGNYAFFKAEKDEKILKENYEKIKKAIYWYRHQDGDQSGLISMEEAADWEDMLAVRDKGLYINILYYGALLKISEMARKLGKKSDHKLYKKMAKDLKKKINTKFWFQSGKNTYEFVSHDFGTENNIKNKKDILGRKLIFPSKDILKKDSYYLHYITFRDFGERFDSFGNLLAIITGIAKKKQSEDIIKFIKKYKLAKPYPIKAIYPPICPGEKEWREYYNTGNLNIPYCYHNGGIWPFLGGFYVAALVKMKKFKEAGRALEDLARLNKKGKDGNWEFNEWFHGKSGKPMGMAEQAWSAGMYIYAYECVRKKKTLFL